MTMRLDHVSDESSFAALRDEWDALLGDSGQDGPFLKHAWLSAWWESFGQGSTLAVVTARDDDGRLLGVLPMARSLAGRVVPYRTGRFLGDAGVGSTGLTPFAAPDAEDAVFARFAQEISSAKCGFDVIDLRYVDLSHSFFRHLVDRTGTTVDAGCEVCPRIDLAPDWEAFLKSLSKHMRHEVRRSMRRVEERGLDVDVPRDAEALPRALDDFLALHEDRMKGKFGPSFELTAPHVAFIKRVAADLLSEDRLRLTFLSDRGTRVAGLFLFRHDDTMYAWMSGFDEETARQDVSRALWGYAVQNTIAEGCTRLDMLLGDQHYKRQWGASNVRELAMVRLYGHSLIGALRRGRDALVRVAENARSRSASTAPESA